MDRGKRIAGVLLIIVSVAALIAWEKWGKEQFLYEEVLVCRENVSRGTVMREELFETIKMDLNEKGWIRPKDKKSLLGKETASFIHKGMPLFPEYFDQAGLSADGKEGKYVLSIPEHWLDSAPASLKRGNRAYFFSGKTFLTSAPVSEINEERRNVEVIVTEKQAAKLSSAAADGEKLVIIYH